MPHPVADYLHELYLISGVSVPETSGYPALSKLLNAVGESLKPKISTMINPANNGAGIPDGDRRHHAESASRFERAGRADGEKCWSHRRRRQQSGPHLLSREANPLCGRSKVSRRTQRRTEDCADHIKSRPRHRRPLGLRGPRRRHHARPGKVTTGTRGEGYLDIHLNATTRWKDVPEPVWNYTLGGYQILKKWLSYRETALLGRALTSDEAQHFTHHVRRITSILALHEKLDGHYEASV